ncbi:GNAT family N-acetyltransferase [Patulibacter sp. SYSU D01012]|uniref:GNAT family N-acetyltransferase n=1 Tax=Patulibacter sp. SYSU D01012 TaxID=2817381 RepID=UPI001B30C40F|nr:GNAT family N-acetyltransferase [Patulibacter sp. SYSU D01012]
MSTPAPSVRPLRPADREAWQALWDGYLRFYREDLDPHVTDVTFGRLCAGEDAMFGLVAVDGEDRPVGFAHALLHGSTWSPAGYCYLEDLFVGPAARGGAAGRALIDATAAEARRRGATKLYWHTQSYNGRARSLYDQAGALSSQVVYERELG